MPWNVNIHFQKVNLIDWASHSPRQGESSSLTGKVANLTWKEKDQGWKDKGAVPPVPLAYSARIAQPENQTGSVGLKNRSFEGKCWQPDLQPRLDQKMVRPLI
jgi:hypothetical protein